MRQRSGSTQEYGHAAQSTKPVFPAYRFSGHETFACRYSWLPKAFTELLASPLLFADEESAMVRLGVGRNMVKSIRFWVQAAGIAEQTSQGIVPTEFGKELLDQTSGADPYLEDVRTLWLLHWKISTIVDDPLFAWEFLLNKWQHPEITRTDVIAVFTQEAGRLDRKLSAVTLEQHFDTFLHTYYPTRSSKNEVREDNLDSPFVELDLIQRVGERRSQESSRNETVYAFNREPKPAITHDLFAYCIQDYWLRRLPNEATLSFRDIAVNMGSVGQIFKLPEADIRDRLERLEEHTEGLLRFKESASVSNVIRQTPGSRLRLSSIYESELLYV